MPRTRTRNLLKLGTNPDKGHIVTLSRKGYSRLSRNKIAHHCFDNLWSKEQKVPEMSGICIKPHYGERLSPIPVI